MDAWKTFDTPPSQYQRVIVIFYWFEMGDYNMTIQSWDGWHDDLMEHDGWGFGTYPVRWMEAPDYPELPEIHG